MTSFRTIFYCCLLAGSPVLAADTAATQRYPSPKGDLVLLHLRHPDKPDIVRLEGVSGKVFLTLAVEDDMKEGEIKEGSLIWSAGADGVAFAVGNTRSFKAHAFIRAKEGWKHIKLPEPGDEKTVWDSYHSVPTKWQGDRLSLTVSGPHAEKSAAPGYSGSMVVAIDVERGTAKKVEESIVVVPAKEKP
jgi:hypothetical protein